MELGEVQASKRRQIQAERIVKRLKDKTHVQHSLSSKRIRKSKRNFGSRKNSESTLSGQTGSEEARPWFRDEKGRVRAVQFLLGKPPGQVSWQSMTFSAIFKEVAKKFKSPKTPSSICTPNAAKMVNDNAHDDRTAISESKSPLSREDLEITPREVVNIPDVQGLDFENLKKDFKLNYLY